MKKILGIIILVFLATACFSQNNKVAIKHHEKCVDDFCLSNTEDQLMTIEDADKYIRNGHFTLLNREKSCYLRMTHYPGDPKYKMSLFEIGYISNEDISVFYEYNGPLLTDNRTSLGDTEETVIELQGVPHQISVIDNYKVYRYMEDESTSEFVKENNEYAYFIEYWFINGKLAKLVFGFDYP